MKNYAVLNGAPSNAPKNHTSTEVADTGYIGVILGLHWGYIGIMENQMKTTIVDWDCVGFICKGLGFLKLWVPVRKSLQ